MKLHDRKAEEPVQLAATAAAAAAGVQTPCLTAAAASLPSVAIASVAWAVVGTRYASRVSERARPWT